MADDRTFITWPLNPQFRFTAYYRRVGDAKERMVRWPGFVSDPLSGSRVMVTGVTDTFVDALEVHRITLEFTLTGGWQDPVWHRLNVVVPFTLKSGGHIRIDQEFRVQGDTP